MRKTLTFGQASTLYLITMLLILGVGIFLREPWSPLAPVGFELVFILLPTLIWLRYAKVPFKQGLRLRWPGWHLIVIGALLGVAGWFLGALVDSISAPIFGYQPGVDPAAFPHDLLSSFSYFLAVVIAAPIAEEILFRGALQGAFRKQSVRFGFLFTALLFMLFHLRFQGLATLLPLALLLGYVVERSNSLYTGVALHFAYNALATFFTLGISLRPDLFVRFRIEIGYLASLVGGIVLLSMFARQSPRQPKPRKIRKASVRQRLSFAVVAPFVIVILAYAQIARQEYITGRHPEFFAQGQKLEFEPISLSEPLKLEYSILTPLGDPVGDATCTMEEQGTDVVLNCKFKVIAFTASEGESAWADSGHLEVLDIRWDAETMHLVSFDRKVITRNWSQTYTAKPEGGAFDYVAHYYDYTEDRIELPEGALISGEWVWRAMALPFELAYARETTIGLPFAWDPETEEGGMLARPTVLRIVTATPLHVPAGNFLAWFVVVDNQAAWYETAEPHRLLRWVNEYTIWELK